MPNRTVKALAASIVLALLLGVGPAGSSGPSTVDNGIWSWWTHPIAQVDGSGRTWIGSIARAGTQRVHIVDTDGTVTTVPLRKVEANDHNAPAVVTAPGRPALAFGSQHARADYIDLWEISTAGDILAHRRITGFDGGLSYAQPLVFGDRIVLLTRAAVCRWFYVVSDDWGKTWDTPRLLVNECDDTTRHQMYVTSAPHHGSDKAWRIAVVSHPNTPGWDEVQYGLLYLDSGNITVPGGTVVANIYSGEGLPLADGQLDGVYEPPAGHRSRLFDLATVDGMPAIVVAEWADYGSGVRGPARMLTIRYDGQWTQHEVGRYSGDPFWQPSNYLGGGQVGPGDMLYTSAKVGNGWRIERWGWNGTGWDWKANVHMGGRDPVVRPYVPRGGQGQWRVLTHRLDRYVDYKDYDADIMLHPY